MVKQCYSNELYHHGVKGQKWGVRRYQDDDGLRIKSGTDMYRISSVSNESHKGHAYVSYLDDDVRGYEGVASLLNAGEVAIPYEMKMKTLEDIVTPSRKEATDAYIHLLSTNKEFNKQAATHKHSLLYPVKTKHLNTAKKEAKSFKNAQAYMANDVKLRSMYFDELSRRGYNAMNDYADIDTGMAKQPLIIFDREKTLGKAAVSMLNPV